MTPLAYLASAYTRRAESPGGLEAAYVEACALAGRLISSGVHVFSPVAHSHGIAIHAKIDPLNQEFWMHHCETMLHVCRTLIVAHTEGWEQSTGVAYEIEFFEKRGRPIFDLAPDTLKMVRR